MSKSLFIPQRFIDKIELHLYKNETDQNGTPLIMLISGPPGEGKSFQLEVVLKKHGAKIFRISTGELENKNSGVPAEIVRERYLAASCFTEDNPDIIAVLVFDDIDAGIGNFGNNTQYTVNTQNVSGELMAIADKPRNVAGQSTNRIPIFMTCNDSSKLYEPLRRTGRLTQFVWVPTIQEKIAMVLQLFSSLDEQKASELVKSIEKEYLQLYCQQKEDNVSCVPVSFYSHLLAELNDAIHLSNIKSLGLRRAISVKHLNALFTESHECSQVLSLAKKLLKENKSISFIS